MFIVFFFFVFRIVCIRHRRKVHIRYLISDEFLVFIWVLLFFCTRNLGCPVATLPPTPQLTYAMWSIRVSCNATIYPS